MGKFGGKMISSNDSWLCIWHVADSCHATASGSRRTMRKVLFMRRPRIPKVYVHVDSARENNLAGRIDMLIAIDASMLVNHYKRAVFDSDIRSHPPCRRDELAILNDQIALHDWTKPS